ncbi:MAG TPA: tetratricopeptide repeat protein [Candidatus Acidoferrum sp.]|nr:tetratricopeptide repeat protein [Candidatus Acidoferrum sp.]
MRFLPLLFLPLCLAAQQKLIDQGFEHFYNLEYDEAISAFEKAVAESPSSPDVHNHLAQTLVFREMFRNGALESELVNGNNSFLRRAKLNPSPETEKRFLDEVSKAIELSEARLKQNPKDTAAMYAEGIAYGLRSNYFWVVKKAWRDSLKDATSARRLHNRVSELEPNNVDARLVQGLHDYIVGSLPWNYRMLGFLVGVHGDKAKGIRTVQEVAANGKLNRMDARILLCALYRRESQAKSAIPIVQELIERYPRNFLLRLELAQMYSTGGDGVRGLETLREVERLKNAHTPGFDRLPWEKLWFQEGSIQFWYNDLDQSLENMKRVTARADDVDLNTGVMAWLRMGQIYDMKQRRAEAMEAYRKAIAYAPQAEAAQEAKKYLSTPYRRI